MTILAGADPAAPAPGVTGAILAGGESRRLGRDKATLCNGPCERCAVYLNRDVKREKILEKTPVPE